ncbi:hypothetical protein DSAG12_02649 [Promethearchaeum syntrophicum]|uniref:Uncharacterized protein n=1 Tax=Promethearchaeum syntrophicum TaxID=2594042 RepID=A0A5B9DC06_9ARCH|nr:hypothetical protein DSAG12_02649 [Candidatus Prometheoarchaeum syntrophicum]
MNLKIGVKKQLDLLQGGNDYYFKLLILILCNLYPDSYECNAT